MDRYSLAFSLSNLGPKRFQAVLNKFGTAENGWNGTREEYTKLDIVLKTFETFDEFRRTFDIESYIKRLEKERVTFIPFRDKLYPVSLTKMENPPIGLFAKGNLELLSARFCIGVVGTRKITSYGHDVTEMIVMDLVKNGACIVSGLALGVDGTAHRTTVEYRGKAIAVLACGVDCCLPSEHFSLYNDILKNDGLIVSEYPLSQPPNKGTFLARNRIIAAISDGILITEAAEDSGSLVTAQWGFTLGKKIFAVPGPINSAMAKGSLKLLKQGGILVQDVDDILSQFKDQKSNSKAKFKDQKLKNLSKEEKKIVSLLENEGLTIDEIAKAVRFPISKLFVDLSTLELKGIVKNNGGKWSIT